MRRFASLIFCPLIMALDSCEPDSPRTGMPASTATANRGYPGIYHQDRWGVGRFGSDFVAPELHDRLKAFDGKAIYLVSDLPRKRMNRNLLTCREIESIEELPPAPLAIRAGPGMAVPFPDAPFYMMVHLINRGNEPIRVRGVDILVVLYGRNKSRPASKTHF